MRHTIPRSTFALLFAVWTVTGTAFGDTKWPVQPTSSDQPIGATLGEFQANKDGEVYQHNGIDILVPRCDPASGLCDDPCGGAEDPVRRGCVFSTVTGIVDNCNDDPNEGWTSARIKVTNGSGTTRYYSYVHLTAYGWDLEFKRHCELGDLVGVPLPAGSAINRVGDWTCDYNHLHYTVWEPVGTNRVYLNGLQDIEAAARPDTQTPEIFRLDLARRATMGWTQFPIVGSCTVVNGDVDVVAQLRDRDDAGSSLPPGLNLPGTTNVGIYNLRWRACPQSDPDCAWNETHKFERMPSDWASPAPTPHTQLQFSTATPFPSDFNECAAPAAVNKTYMVATSEPSALWATAGGTVPNGTYTVSVEASDLAGNISTATVNACVQNEFCGDLLIRDAVDDPGTVPYTGPVFYLSPDITANPGGVDENKNVREDSVNNIAVQVWNKGTCNLPAGTTYQVCLGWSPPSGSVPFPLPANQRVSCQTETVPAGGWAQNTARTTSFNWLPLAGTLPLGHACLVAWSSSAVDLPQTTPSVVYDNNRAQRNIAFVALPAAGETSSADYWMYELPELFERSVQFSFHFERPPPVPWNLSVVVPPSFRVSGLANARVVASFRARGADALDRCLAGDEASCLHQCSNDEVLEERACTVVLGGFGGEGPVVLHGIEVDEPVKLRLAVTGPRSGPRGGPFEIRVTERGALLGQPAAPVGGVTYRFEERDDEPTSEQPSLR